jgi:adenosylcobinamide-GDP ribazoletransferase
MLAEPTSDDAKVEAAPPAGSIVRFTLGFVAALQFLTIVPPLVRRPFSGVELGRAVGWFPVIGLMLGSVLVLLDVVLAPLFPHLLSSALLLVVWVLFTGALHLDGLLDSCDGFFGGRTPEDRLRIMRDERVGAYAVIGCVLLLLVKYLALLSLPLRVAALCTAPVLGRAAMALAIVVFPYAREEGLGRAMKDHATTLDAAMAVALAGFVAAWLGGWVGLVAAGGALGFTLLAGWFIRGRLPGLTGDLYGAICELVEVLTLLSFVAGERLS